MQTRQTRAARIILAVVALALFLTLRYRNRPSYEAPADDTLFTPFDVPAWSGEASVPINGNRPAFREDEITDAFFETFSDLDALGRCGVAFACVGTESMPEGERTSIGMIRPSGWQIAKYDFIDNGGFLYNRCHLIAWVLTGQNDEVRNLITGTRYMNTQGMLPYEVAVANYIRDTGNHVMYRVTPQFYEDEMLARGVRLEAWSVEDAGEGISFHVFCYNVQPGVAIDYRTGESSLEQAP